MSDDRAELEALEIKLSHQERLVAELSSELYGQSQRLDRLEKLLRDMTAKVTEISDSAEAGAPGDVRPPHW